MTTTNRKNIHHLPILFVACYSVPFMAVWLHVISHRGEVEEAVWHYVLGLINLPIYVLTYESINGLHALPFLGYPVYFALIGVLHWGLIGYCVTFITAWQEKSDRNLRKVVIALWLVPLFSVALIVAVCFVFRLRIIHHVPSLTVVLYGPFLALLVSLFLRKWLLCLYAGATFLIALWFTWTPSF